MSFILDALKKSESERQRQTGPGLFEVKVAPPRNRLPAWAVLIGVLLLVNLGVVGWMLWHGSSKRTETKEAQAPAVPDGAAAPPQRMVQAAPMPSAAPPMAPPTAADQLFNRAPFNETPPGGAQAPAGTGSPPSVARSDAGPSLDESDAEVLNPDDYEPAIEAPPQPKNPRQASSGVVRGTESGLPTYQDVLPELGSSLPELRLDLHVYDPNPSKRFVFVNMQKLRVGDSTQQGLRLENITQDGAVLSFRGKQFVLLKQ